MKISAGFIKSAPQQDAVSFLPIPKIFSLPTESSISLIEATPRYCLSISGNRDVQFIFLCLPLKKKDKNEIWIWGDIPDESSYDSKRAKAKPLDVALEISALLYLQPKQIHFDSVRHKISKISCAATNCLMLTGFLNHFLHLKLTLKSQLLALFSLLELIFLRSVRIYETFLS